jgi:hypothetical protein
MKPASGGEIMKRASIVLFLAAVFFSSFTTYAHHSFASTYDEAKKVTIEGKLVQFLFRNPHSFVHVMAPDEHGDMQRWAVEWGGAGQLGGQGVTRETLRPGDKVVIAGNPGRNPEDHRIRMVSLLRPSDGFGWGQKKGEIVD